MLFLITDLYHFIIYFTSKTCKLHCADGVKSCSAINLTEQLPTLGWPENKITTFS